MIHRSFNERRSKLLRGLAGSELAFILNSFAEDLDDRVHDRDHPTQKLFDRFLLALNNEQDFPDED